MPQPHPVTDDRMTAPPPPAAAVVGIDPTVVMAKAQHENFPVAAWFLPRVTRRHLLAIYGFARLTDDLGDEAHGDRLAQLDWLEAELRRASAGTARHPIMRRLAATIDECRLPLDPFLSLIEANRMDQHVTRYATFADLRRYCRLSAEPVGRLVLMVAGELSREREAWSDDVCTGLQLAEHWQDVAEDAAHGRIYLPREDLERFGVDESDVLHGVTTQAFRRLIAFEVDRARGLLAAGTPLARSVGGRLGVAIAAFAGGGTAALDAIAAAGFDVLRHRTHPGRGRTLLRTLGAMTGVGMPPHTGWVDL